MHVVTDEEKREVAERLRQKAGKRLVTGDDIEEAIWNDAYSGFNVDDAAKTYNRLADLIDPGDTSQSCRDTVACDREAPETCEHWLDGECYALMTARPVDREALLALADAMDRDGRLQRERQKSGERWFIDGLDVREYARRIREACGEAVE